MAGCSSGGGRQAVFFVRMDPSGYVLDSSAHAPPDHSAGGHGPVPSDRRSRRSEAWAEVAAAGGSRIVRFSPRAVELSVAALPTEIEDAGTPVVSADGSRLGFIRTERGRGHLWLLERSTGAQRPVTSADWDVFDFGFFPDNRVVFAGRRGATPGLFVIGAGAAVSSPTPLVPSDRPMRNPAVSPDGRWLAYAERDARKLATLASVAGSEREPEADERRLQQHQPRVAPGFQEPGLRHRLRARRRADRARRVARRSVRHNCRRDVGKPSGTATLATPPLRRVLVRAERRWRLPDLAAVWQYRELFWVLALRDIRVRYKQTLLGVAWAMVQPLCTMIVFTTISHFARIATDGVPARGLLLRRPSPPGCCSRIR